jgi:hypothetical protein
VADGFLGRWSKRKLDAKEGRELEPEPAREVAAGAPPPQPSPGGGSKTAASSPPPPGEGQGGGAPAPEPPPTLEDAQALTPESDFTRFTRADVAPEVKNTALKKLFADPRYNIQDGLDVYIDDYSKPDPLPESMLRQLASAQFLNLFREEEGKEEKAPGVREEAEGEPNASVAQSGSGATDAPADRPPDVVPPDADPDLRLQQDDAAAGGQPGHGAG